MQKVKIFETDENNNTFIDKYIKMKVKVKVEFCRYIC